MGDCHYLYGNYATKKRISFLRDLLGFVGIESDRLRSRWISSAEGPEFAHEVIDFIDSLKAMGPSPLNQAEKVLRAA